MELPDRQRFGLFSSPAPIAIGETNKYLATKRKCSFSPDSCEFELDCDRMTTSIKILVSDQMNSILVKLYLSSYN